MAESPSCAFVGVGLLGAAGRPVGSDSATVKVRSRAGAAAATSRRRMAGRRPTVMAAAPPPADIPDVLVSIIERKKDEVVALREEMAADEAHPVRVMLEGPAIERERRFMQSINKPPGTLSVIAEIKRKSPSKGHIASIVSAASLARAYHSAGASAISVLTDFPGFGGTMEDLKETVVSQQRFQGGFPGPCPVLRKDFTIDECQIAEAAVAGASAVLLIVAALGGDRTAELLKCAHHCGLDALVEVHNGDELDAAIAAGAEVLGVNNRDLRTFEVSLDTAESLYARIPKGIVTIAESGIKDALDAWKVRDMGYNAILVGEALCIAAEDTGMGASATMYQPGYNMAKGLIKAFKSKGSSTFGSSSSAMFTGKGEGAKETLGEISI